MRSIKPEIEIEQRGRAGVVTYIEAGRLPLYFEILGVRGIGLDVRTPQDWDAYCEKHGASWAKGRRDEIVARVAKHVLKKRYGKGSYKIADDRWLHIYPRPSLLSRLADRFG